MKGIILAGGSGSRLNPITPSISKQLLPVYDKPMIYYPLSVLMLAGIQEILIISTPTDIPQFQSLLQDGSQFGLQVTYKVQKLPKGIGEAFLIGENFIKEDPVCLVLGDNIFYGQSFSPMLKKAVSIQKGALVFTYNVKDPSRFGILEEDENGTPVSIQEKPSQPKSNSAITGLYFYDNQVISIAKRMKPSARGELEITDINQQYLAQEQLQVQHLGRGFTWLDCGTFNSLLQASSFVETIQNRQGFKIACIEEIAYYMNYIGKEELITLGRKMNNSPYGQYLLETAHQKKPGYLQSENLE